MSVVILTATGMSINKGCCLPRQNSVVSTLFWWPPHVPLHFHVILKYLTVIP
jgi:hypothetical protein